MQPGGTRWLHRLECPAASLERGRNAASQSRDRSYRHPRRRERRACRLQQEPGASALHRRQVYPSVPGGPRTLRRCRGLAGRRRQLDDAGQGLCGDALLRRSTRSRRRTSASSRCAFTFSTGTTKGFEAPPLVVNGTMYIITPFPNYPLRARPHQAGRAGQVDVQAQAAAASQGVACCDVVNRGAVYDDGQDLLQHARRPDHRGRRQQRPAGVADAARRHPEGRDDHHGAAGRGRQSAGRQFGRRDGRARLDRRARRRQRQARVEGVQHRPRQGRADRPATSIPSTRWTAARTSASRAGRPTRGRSAAAPSGAGSATTPRPELVFYGVGNPGPVESRPAARRQQVDDRSLRARHRHRRGASGIYQSTPHDLFDHDDINEIILADMPWGNGRRPVHAPPGPRRLLLRPGPPHRPGAVGGAVRLRQRLQGRRPQDRPDHPQPRQGPEGRARGARHLPGGARLSRTGTRQRSARSPASSTSRTTISAWTSARCRRTTSPARPTSAPT